MRCQEPRGNPGGPAAASWLATAQAIRPVLAATAVAGVTAAAGAPLLVRLALPQAFAPAATAFQLLVPGVIAAGLGRMLAGVAAGHGRPLLPALARLVSLGLTLPLTWLLLPPLGIHGAALASTVAAGGYTVCLVALGRRALGWRWQDLLVPTAADVRAACHACRSVVTTVGRRARRGP
jgi:O-antigen/teichoic acid export membrane protein